MSQSHLPRHLSCHVTVPISTSSPSCHVTVSVGKVTVPVGQVTVPVTMRPSQLPRHLKVAKLPSALTRSSYLFARSPSKLPDHLSVPTSSSLLVRSLYLLGRSLYLMARSPSKMPRQHFSWPRHPPVTMSPSLMATSPSKLPHHLPVAATPTSFHVAPDCHNTVPVAMSPSQWLCHRPCWTGHSPRWPCQPTQVSYHRPSRPRHRPSGHIVNGHATFIVATLTPQLSRTPTRLATSSSLWPDHRLIWLLLTQLAT